MLQTRQGMRQHHTKVHGEPLPNRTCVDCGSDFYQAKAQRKFCYDCNHNAGTNNGNWKDAKETAECRLCGGTFEFYPSDAKGVYCPSCVEESDEFLGDASWEVNDIERVDRDCEQCGKEFEILQSDLDYHESQNHAVGRFCSRECHSEWMSHEWIGEAHPAWRGGPKTYAGKWWNVRKQALERDGYECQICGSDESELGQSPDVHHITPIRKFEHSEEAHYLDKVISLCRKCHINVEYGHLEIPN